MCASGKTPMVAALLCGGNVAGDEVNRASGEHDATVALRGR